MLFANDTEEALISAAALINTTKDPGVDTLATRADLDTWVAEQRYTGSRRHDDAELRGVRKLRDGLRTLWDDDESVVVSKVNAMLREGRALPQLVKHDHWDWHLHGTTDDAPLETRMGVEIAMGFVDLIRAGETDRLKHCAADGCDGVLVDLSRNRSRRFCSTACSNRVAAAAYRARKSGG